MMQPKNAAPQSSQLDRSAETPDPAGATPPRPQSATPPFDTAHLSPPLPSVPGYEIDKELGRGGMGVVYRARHKQLNRVVALKVLRAGDFASAADRMRFVIEAEMVARVKHPHIVQVYEVGAFEEQPYCALEYIDGGSLQQLLKSQRLSARETAQFVATLADAVQAAHSQGIIHRDLKPANILLDVDGSPKITDFGLAKQTAGGANLTTSGAIVGTPKYMSPEQAAGDLRRQGPLVDVWSLGIIMYELLTGSVPFQADSAMTTLELVRNAVPLPPRRVTPDLPLDLEVICLKCLEREPERRYASAADLAADLRRYLEDRPILARPAGRLEKSWRWCRRNKTAAALAATMALLAMTLSAGGPLVAWRESGLRQQAETAELRARDEETKAKKSAEAERVAKESAERRLGQIKKFDDILLSIFHDLDPKSEEKGGPSLHVQLGRRLGEATAQLEEEAVGDPLMVAHLQTDLGVTQTELGNLEQALTLLEKARATRTKLLGPNHPDTLATIHNLASAYRETGRAAEAIPLLEQVRDQWLKQLGPRDKSTLLTQHELAFAYKAVGRTADAVALYERVRDGRIETLGPDDPATLNTLNNLANAYRETGRTKQAVTLFEQVRDSQVKTLGADHPDTFITLQNLALAYRDAGRIDEAIPILERVRDHEARKIGPDHPDTLKTILALANTYRLAGRHAEAIALLEPARDQSAKKLGPDHPITLAMLNALATTYQFTGRVAEAVAIYEQVLEQARKSFGPEHPNTLATLNNLAGAYHLAGRDAQAIPLFEQARDLTEKKLGPDHPLTVSTLSNLAVAYRSERQFDRSGLLFEEVLKRQRARFGSDHPEVLATLRELGQNYRDAGKLADALSRFEEAVRRAKDRPGPPLLTLPSFLADLGSAYILDKKFTEAETVLRECLSVKEKQQRDDWIAAYAKSQLGEALWRQQKYADAEPLLLAGYEGLLAKEKDIPLTGKNNLPDAINRLVKFYEAWDKPEEAAKWRKKLEATKTRSATENK
jgi:tetratricopeptide (TPR) repeat protein/predicted Ser/Thr protein kinase